MASAAGATDNCGRIGCGVVVDSSALCRNQDQLNRQSCVLQALQTAASSGPLTAEHYQQATDILTSNPDNPTFLCANLHVLATALSRHPPSDPTQAPDNAVSSHLLPALSHVLKDVPESIHPHHRPHPHQVLLADAIGAYVNAILTPPFQSLLDDRQTYHHNDPILGQKHGGWERALHQGLIGRTSQGNPPLLYRLMSCALPTLSAGDVAAYHDAAAAAAQLLKVEQPPVQFRTPGAEALLAFGSLIFLQCPSYRHVMIPDPYKLVPRMDMFHSKIVMLLEREVAHRKLPHAGLTVLLGTMIPFRNYALCTALARSRAALAVLAQPLEALAADITLWENGTYQHHVGPLLALAQWAGNQGAKAVIDSLAGHLVQPALKAVGLLLQLHPVPNPRAKDILHRLLALLVPLAMNDTARKSIAAPGNCPQWLGAAVSWQGCGTVAADVLSVLVMAVSIGFEAGDRSLHNCVQRAREELTLKSSLKAMATFLESSQDLEVKHQALMLLSAVCSHRLSAIKPLVRGLLGMARPQALVAGRAAAAARRQSCPPVYAEEEVVDGRMADAFEFDCQLALRMFMKFHCQAGPSSTAAMVAGLEPAQQIVLEWLDAFAAGTNPDGALSHPETLINLFGNLELLLVPELLGLKVMIHRHVLENVASLMPKLTTDKEWCAALSFLDSAYALCTATAKTKESITSADGAGNRLAQGLAKPGVLECLLRRVSHDWDVLSGQAAPVRLARLMGSEAGVVMSADERMEHLYRMHVVVAVGAMVWTLPGQEAAALKLLNATEYWQVVGKAASCAQGEYAVKIGVLFQYLYLQVAKHVGEPRGAAAGAALRCMERRVVLQYLKSMPQAMQAVVQHQVFVVGKLPNRQAASSSKVPASTAHAKAASRSDTTRHDIATRTASTSANSKASSPESNGEAGSSGVPATGTRVRENSTQGTLAGKPAAGSTNSSISGAPAATTGAAGGDWSLGAGANAGQETPGCGSTAAPAECSVCHTRPEKVLLCGRCLATRYCSAACQRAAWKDHKKVCKQL